MKRTLIISSILIILVVLSVVMFNFVFCVRNVSVSYLSEGITYAKDDIIRDSKIEKGTSTLMLDKDRAIANIEASFADLKVVEIRTTNLMSIDVRVRARYATYYVERTVDEVSTYYILDEELKVIDISTSIPSLIRIDIEINKDIELGDFILKNNKESLLGLFKAVYTTKLDSKDKLAREEMVQLIESINFDKEYTLLGNYDRLVVRLRTGITFDIGKPNEDLEEKVNICFATAEKVDNTKGVVKVYFDKNDKLCYAYFENI